MQRARHFEVQRNIVAQWPLEVISSVLEGTVDVEESVINNDGDLEGEHPKDDRCPPHLDVVELSKIVPSEVYLEILDDGIVDSLVQIEADLLDCDVRPVDPEVEMDDVLLDVVVDLLVLGVLPFDLLAVDVRS